MRLLKRDLTTFELYKPLVIQDSSGDIRTVYNTQPFAKFDGNIQPCGEKNSIAEYGLDPRYSFFIFTPFGTDFMETDRVFDGFHRYEIKVIQRWSSFLRLLVEEVETNG